MVKIKHTSPAGPSQTPPPATLRRIFPHSQIINNIETSVVKFWPRGPIQNPEINNPKNIDLDHACFMMLTKDLPSLLGVIARPANRKVKIKDLDEFDDWLHIISDPIVVKVYAGNNIEERNNFKNNVIKILSRKFRVILSANQDSLILAQNQVNIPISTISDVFYSLGARICRVQFSGMKWNIGIAEPKIDQLISHYHIEMGTLVPSGKNMFNYGIHFELDHIDLYKFSNIQLRTRGFVESEIHEMCNVEGYGFLAFMPTIDERVKKIKVYQKLSQEILSQILKQNLDDMPTTNRMMQKRLKQLQDLIALWNDMEDVTRRRRMLGYRIEASVCTEKVVDGRQLISELHLLHLDGLCNALGGRFDTYTMTLDDFLSKCQLKISTLAREVHGANAYAPSTRSALTFARQAIGWSGRSMEHHLQEARDWQDVIEQRSNLRDDII